MMKGRFITFEGGEGSGKSTQVRRLAARLRDAGLSVTETREPGGSPGAEAIRGLLLNGEVGRWDALTEALLHYAARRDHLETTVRPALAAGDWVISDRFADSTLAYQGYGHGLDHGVIGQLHTAVVGTFRPDLTLILDIPVEAGLARAAGRGQGADRYERMDLAFHERLRQGFLEIARQEPQRCAVIDATADEAAVAAAIADVATARLGTELS